MLVHPAVEPEPGEIFVPAVKGEGYDIRRRRDLRRGIVLYVFEEIPVAFQQCGVGCHRVVGKGDTQAELVRAAADCSGNAVEGERVVVRDDARFFEREGHFAAQAAVYGFLADTEDVHQRVGQIFPGRSRFADRAD